MMMGENNNKNKKILIFWNSYGEGKLITKGFKTDFLPSDKSLPTDESASQVYLATKLLQVYKPVTICGKFSTSPLVYIRPSNKMGE